MGSIQDQRVDDEARADAPPLGRVTLHLDEIDAQEMRGRWAGPVDRSEYDRHHYRATLYYDRRSAAFRFSTGSAWERPPGAREVLETVLREASSVDVSDSLETATETVSQEFGYEDAAEARKIASALLATARKVHRLLGPDFERAMADPESFAWAVTDDPPPFENAYARASAGTRRHASRVGLMADGTPVNVEIELRAKEWGVELSITSATPHSGGQDRESVAGVVDFAPGWDAERVARLLEVWDAWHLNGAQAACEHQRAAGWGELVGEEVTLYHWRTSKAARATVREAEKTATEALRRGENVALPLDVLELVALPAQVTTPHPEPPAGPYEPNRPQYDGDHYNRPSETKRRGWVRPDEHPLGLLTAPCEVCGYRYGSAWLHETLPADVVAFLSTFEGLEGATS